MYLVLSVLIYLCAQQLQRLIQWTAKRRLYNLSAVILYSYLITSEERKKERMKAKESRPVGHGACIGKVMGAISKERTCHFWMQCTLL